MNLDSATRFALQSFMQSYLTLSTLGNERDAKELRNLAERQYGDDPVIYDLHGNNGDVTFAKICEIFADQIEKGTYTFGKLS